MKTYFYDSEITNYKNLLLLDINAYKEAVKLCDDVKDVIKANDGKQANKRFLKQLEAVNSGLTFNINTSLYGDADINIIFYIKDRCCKACDGEHYIYINYSSIYLSNNNYYKTYKDGRINADEIIKTIDNNKALFINKIERLTAQRKQLKKIANKWTKLLNEARNFRSGIDYIIASYMKMYDANI